MVPLLHAHIILLLYIIFYTQFFVHILLNVNVFCCQFLLLGMNMYNIKETYIRLIVNCSLCLSRWFCLIALHFVVTMYTHRKHTYMIMLCSIFTNHNRMLVVHFVVTSKIDAAMKT